MKSSVLTRVQKTCQCSSDECSSCLTNTGRSCQNIDNVFQMQVGSKSGQPNNLFPTIVVVSLSKINTALSVAGVCALQLVSIADKQDWGAACPTPRPYCLYIPYSAVMYIHILCKQLHRQIIAPLKQWTHKNEQQKWVVAANKEIQYYDTAMFKYIPIQSGITSYYM